MPENEIDQLEIAVKASGTEAANGLERLATALDHLGTASSGVDYSSLRSLSDNLKSLAGLKLSGVGSTINAVAKLSKNVHELESLRNIDPTIFDNLAEGLKSLSELKLSGIGTVLAEVRKLPETFENLDSIVVKEYAAHLQELVDALTPIAEKANEVTSAFQTMSKINVKASLKVVDKNTAAETQKTTINYAQLGRTLSALAKPLNKAADGFKRLVKNMASKVVSAFTDRIKGALRGVERLFATIRRIVFTRAIRAALRQITAGLKEGIDNLYQWSAAVDGRFKASMDQIATSMLYLKNSIAAMVSPIINRLAPAIDYLVDRFVDLLNIVNQVFSALTGNDTWTKAIKYPVEYAEGMADAAKSTKEAAKELKLFLLPFDELNVLTKDNPADTSTPGGAGQGGLNYAEMFETRELEDWAKRIKDLIDQGDWYGAGAALAEHLNSIIEQWDSYAWGEILAEKLNNAISFALGFMRTFEWDTLGERVSQFLRGIIETLNWDDLGALLASKWNALFGFLGGFFRDFSGTDLGVDLSVAFNAWVEEINWDMIGETVNEGVNDVLDGIIAFLKRADTEELGAGIQTMMDKIEWDDIMAKAWEAIKLAIEKTWNLGGDIIEAVWNNGDTGKLTVVVSAFAALAAVVGKVLGVVAKAWPVISKIIELFGGGSGALAGTGATLAAGLPGAAAVGASLGGLGVFGASEANAITKGVNWKNALGNIAGGTLAGAGIGGIIGLAGGPIGAGIGAAAGSQVGLIVTAWTKAIQEIIEHWDQIKEKASEVFDWISEKWGLVTDWISEKWTLVSDWFSEKWAAISTWVDENVIQPVKAVIDPIVEWISTAFEGAWIIVKAAWIIASEWFDTKVIQPIVKLYTDIKEKIVSFLTEAWTRVKAVWAVVSEWFDEKVIQPVIKLYNNVKEKVVGFFTEAWSRVKSTWSVAYQWFNNTIVAPIRRVFEYLGEKIREAFGYSWNMVQLEARRVVNALLGFVESGINSIVHVVNQLIGLFNNVVYAAAKITGDSWTGLTYWQDVHLGRVDWGDENYGAASRGIGGNNEGFGGLADSLRGALFGNDGDSTQNVNVYLDGEQIANNSVKHINRSTVQNGKSPLLA